MLFVHVPFSSDSKTATERVAKRLPRGFKVSGDVDVVSESKMVRAVGVLDLGGDRRSLVFEMESFGMGVQGLGGKPHGGL